MTVPFRLILKKVEMTYLENGHCRFVIWLSGRSDVGEIYIGEATCRDNEDDHLEAVSQATLQAISKAMRRPIEMKLIYGKQMFLAEVAKVVYLVIVQTGSNQNMRLLPGICMFTTLTPEVAARATLNALNRTIAHFA